MPKNKGQKKKVDESIEVPKEVETYGLLLEACREHGYRPVVVARAVGVTVPTMKKAWRRGYPQHGLDPIQSIIEGEQRAARAALAKVDDVKQAKRAQADDLDRWREAQKAREEEIRTRRDEASLVKAGRSNVKAYLAVTGHAIRGSLRRAAEIERLIQDGRDEKGNPIPLMDQVKILRELGHMTRQAAQAAKELVHTERLLLGEPTEIVQVRDFSKMSASDLVEEVQRNVERVRRFERWQAWESEVIDAEAVEGAAAE